MSNTLQIFQKLKSNLNQVILGQEILIDRLLIVLLADGHLQDDEWIVRFCQ